MPNPELVRTREDFRAALARARDDGHRVGFVPTMGALHAGHLELAREAKRRAPYTAVSIFVNPTQFGPNEDLARYPRDLDGDLRRCAQAGVDLVFAPDPSEMYPRGDATRVTVGAIAEPLCGAFRPGHFQGVATVVAKLFALAAPCLAVFGRKDYQQLKVIERMTQDLLFDVEVAGVATVRDTDGLAMSSRNAYLSPEDRVRARSIPAALAEAWSAFSRGERRSGALRELVLHAVVPNASRIDYVAVADPATLVSFEDGASVGDRALVAVALWIDKTRLIDNVVLGEDRSPLGTSP